ncbi:hypothetical protein OHU11_29950 [Streptomyces sp. NBC_00257]|uniref:hypothetical protein n=1 Tax=unclassified Streptomyces TaxID=2593676 RepID=UPI00224F49BA|nr:MULTISPECIES: hypothetical protein [unclassified Streptomyces]MCX5431875.1 hypothetical protein [Streptomyces sp. NBC_00062]
MGAQEAAGQIPPEEHTDTAETVPERPRLALVEEQPEEQAEPGRVAMMCAELGAYLPTPRNLAGLLTGVGEGSAVLLGRGWAWIRGEGEGWDSDSAMRGGGVVLVAYAVGRSVAASLGTYTGYVIPPAVVAWCLVARQYTELAVAVRTATAEAKEVERKRLLVEARKEIAATAKKAAEARTKRRIQEDQADAEVEEDAAVEGAVDGGQDEDAGELTVDDIAAVIRRVAARHPHHLGAHLSDLLPEPELEGWEQAELKAALQDDWGLPVSSFKLTFPGGLARGREGVRLEHLPAAPATPAGAAGGRPPAGVGEGLALVPSQHPAGARSSAPAGTPSGVAAGAVVSPSPTPATPPSQETR